MRRVWGRLAPRFPLYSLVLPGAHSFICRAETCNAWCCRAFSVPLGDGEVQRLSQASGLAPHRFLECADGDPIALPLAQPYLLARSAGSCALLGPDLACTSYEGRPDACREYPYQVLFVDAFTARPVRPRTEQIAAVAALPGESNDASADARHRVLPLLIRHDECPGFTGSLLTETAWAELVRSTVALHYGEPGSADAREEDTSTTVVNMGKPATR